MSKEQVENKKQIAKIEFTAYFFIQIIYCIQYFESGTVLLKSLVICKGRSKV